MHAMRRDAQGRRLCTAHRRNGEPCRAPAINRATICRVHGGSAPQVKAKAHEVRLADLIGPALMLLRDLIRDEGEPAALRLRAAIAVLDRTGYAEGMPRPSVKQVEEITGLGLSLAYDIVT